jgi:NADPH-dependent 2,4-dienoyl-CoA reductase/sulfur reductase-like enzyme
MKTDILIVGAGPAGLAAAASAAESGAAVDIIDDNFSAGGQIWRGGAASQKDPRARELWQKLKSKTNVRFHFQTRVVHAIVHANSPHQILTESADTSSLVETKKLILATGARELLLPFPGWTLPGVTGAGGLQALAKNGFPVDGKRVIVTGSGPLLLAVAASLIERGAIVTHILEQAKLPQLAHFALSLLATPSKIAQALALRKNLSNVKYSSNSYITAAMGDSQLKQVRVRIDGQEQTLECDYLACGFGLIPNIDLAASVNCALDESALYAKVAVDEWQKTSMKQVYSAGESTGIGGVDLALAEGSIAGWAATGRMDMAQKIFTERKHWQAFSQRLKSAFALRPELRQLCQADTLVCRCEDVSYAQLQEHDNWRSAKLHTRCGMGACQGRFCGAANHVLFGWNKDAGRLPFSNAKINSLSNLSNFSESHNSLSS